MLPSIKKPKKPVYLDYAATTFVDSKVLKAMQPFWSRRFGNPSALYGLGREADFALKAARKTIAGPLNARPEEVIFTAGGTESINLAIGGVARNFYDSESKRPHLITTAIEHQAVLHTMEALKKEGCDLTVLGVDREGFVSVSELIKAIRPETVLVSVMYANNEIGTIQPIAKITKALRGINHERSGKGLRTVYFHTDACQAAGSLDMDVVRLGVDLLSANGSKIYGPKQTGFLYVKSGVPIKPLIYGGGQERNLRSGTENVAGMVGLAEAFRMAQRGRLKENRRLAGLRDYFIAKIRKHVPKAVLNGPEERGLKLQGHELRRLPNNVNFSILDIEGESLLLYLDSYGICASTGSACTSQSLDPSHVLLAIGRPYEYAHGSVRFTLGKDTDKREIDFVMKVLPPVVEELRRISPVRLDPAHQKPIAMQKAFAGIKTDKLKKK